jgi:hypothetical protein
MPRASTRATLGVKPLRRRLYGRRLYSSSHKQAETAAPRNTVPSSSLHNQAETAVPRNAARMRVARTSMVLKNTVRKSVAPTSTVPRNAVPKNADQMIWGHVTASLRRTGGGTVPPMCWTN